jgi:hypothetical protein
LIIARELIHEREEFSSGENIHILINEWGGEIILRTSLVKVPIINTYLDHAFLFGYEHDIGDPFCKRHEIDETNVQ